MQGTRCLGSPGRSWGLSWEFYRSKGRGEWGGQEREGLQQCRVCIRPRRGHLCREAGTHAGWPGTCMGWLGTCMVWPGTCLGWLGTCLGWPGTRVGRSAHAWGGWSQTWVLPGHAEHSPAHQSGGRTEASLTLMLQSRWVPTSPVESCEEKRAVTTSSTPQTPP